MAYRLREFDAEGKFASELKLEAIQRAVPTAEIKAALQDTAMCEKRQRKFTMGVVVLLVIAMSIYTHLSLGHVMRKIARGLRFVWPDADYEVGKDSAITYRRYQLGARPLVAVFHRVCKPIATARTPGAFLFGLRLMAIDGTVEDVPDTPENAAAFGRQQGPRGQSAFPQVRGVYLSECGSHTIVDAGFWPYATSERVGALRMLRSVGAGMLVMWDRGMHAFDMFLIAQRQGAHVVGRLASNLNPKRIRTLPDGSYLAHICPADYQRRKRGECLTVRIITYTLTDPALPGYGERHRLATTLLDPQRYPALELVCAYHERWEVELVIDEMDTHQRLAGRPLRSLKPVGVIQELYGLLIAHYAIRVLMHEAAVQAGLDPDRLSFVHALRVIRDAVPEFQMTTPDDHPRLFWRLLSDIAAGRLPERRLRSNPRVVKRKMSNFRLKRPQHDRLPQPACRSFRQAVAFI